jgi:ketosteroid isomerase-like protein
MSQGNVDLIRAMYDAYERGDYEAALSFMDDEIEFVGPPDISGDGEPIRGTEGTRRAVARWLASWESYRFELRDLVEVGERVVATGWQSGRGRGSGAEVSEEIFSVWTMREGKIVGQSMFRDRQQALDAAGLRD